MVVVNLLMLEISKSDVVSGCDKLGKLGTVYVPAAQVDPNLSDAEHKVLPLN